MNVAQVALYPEEVPPVPVAELNCCTYIVHNVSVAVEGLDLNYHPNRKIHEHSFVLGRDLGIQDTYTSVKNSEHQRFELESHSLFQNFSLNRHGYTYMKVFLASNSELNTNTYISKNRHANFSVNQILYIVAELVWRLSWKVKSVMSALHTIVLGKF